AATPPGAGPPTGQTPLLTPEPLPAGGKPRRRAPLLAAVGALLAVVLGGGAYALLNRQDDGEEAAPAAPAAAPTGATASPVDMVQAPAGAYPLGIDNPDLAESPLRTQQVTAPYWIDRTEVRNDQYAQFVAAGAAPPLGWVNGRPPATPNSGEPDHPVQGVSFAWAQAYCQALGKRLPTEAEWEIAARGGTKNLWPWGDKVDDVALPRDGSYAVGSIEGNKSAFGVYDTVGNVWEWVDMTYDQRVPADKKVLRGGQNGYLRRTMNRLPADPNLESALRGAGFRCAADGVDPAAAALQFGPFDKPAVAEPNKPPAPPPGVLLADDFTDPRSGWVEVRKETWRYGYHPNEYFHLEATAPRTAVPAPSFARYERSRNLVVSTTAFVEQNLTAPEGGFEFGLMTGAVEDKSYLAFTVNPRKQTWQVFTRQADGSRATITEGRYNVPEIVALEIANDGDSFEFRIGSEGTRLTAVAAKTVPGLTGDGVGFYLETAEAPKAHVHYRGFVVKENSK
ncbi:MAG: formylglycine-generating enzyme family protein, partial [Acidimicrobiales bacterium]